MIPFRYLNFCTISKDRKENMYLTNNILCRTQGTVMPFGPTGIMVSPPFCHPILMIMVQDIVCGNELL